MSYFTSHRGVSHIIYLMDSSSIPEMKPFYWICETEIETEIEIKMEKEMVRERCNQIQISET